MSRQIRVLVVDDSAVARAALTRGLEMDPNILVVGQARDPFEARDRILELSPEVMTLDVEMPRMDGVEFLRRLMPQRPIPVVVVSSLTQKGGRIAMEALEAGAVDVVAKPTRNLSGGLDAMLVELRTKVKIASTVNVSRWKLRPAAPQPPVTRALSDTTDKIIAIGASTGGTEAIRAVLDSMPASAPGIVIVQHMPAGFTTAFAQRLDESSAVQVREAKDGDRVFPGRALLAPGGMQMRLMRSGGEYRVQVGGTLKVSGHCPSVDVLFSSTADCAGRNAVGALLTGMGADGAAGLLRMRQAGARTLAQDEATSVVWGMPRVAWEKGAAERLEPIEGVAGRILQWLTVGAP
jgi:two-component system chemotaxis response regulator CheB